MEWLKLGGFIDLTTGPEPVEEGEISVAEALKQIKAANLPLSRVTVSSDSNGSLPAFNGQGELNWIGRRQSERFPADFSTNLAGENFNQGGSCPGLFDQCCRIL